MVRNWPNILRISIHEYGICGTQAGVDHNYISYSVSCSEPSLKHTQTSQLHLHVVLSGYNRLHDHHKSLEQSRDSSYIDGRYVIPNALADFDEFLHVWLSLAMTGTSLDEMFWKWSPIVSLNNILFHREYTYVEYAIC